MNRINLYDKYGNSINLSSLSLFGLKLHVPSPSYESLTERVDGGEVLLVERLLNPRELMVEFLSTSPSYIDSLILRDELFAILNSGKQLFIGEVNVSGKRWRVFSESWNPDRIGSKTQYIEIPLFAPSGLAESVNIIKRTFTENRFFYRNDGTYEINMRKQNETEIIFKGASTNLKIKNLTTGDSWGYDGTTVITDEIKLKGVRSLKNHVSIFKDTNKKMVNLAVGNNEFEIEGATGEFELTIRTRFYFL